MQAHAHDAASAYDAGSIADSALMELEDPSRPNPDAQRGRVQVYKYLTTFPVTLPTAEDAAAINAKFVEYEWGSTELMARRRGVPSDAAAALPAYLSIVLGGITEDQKRAAHNEFKAVEVQEYMAALRSTSALDALRAADAGERALLSSARNKARWAKRKAALAAVKVGGGSPSPASAALPPPVLGGDGDNADDADEPTAADAAAHVSAHAHAHAQQQRSAWLPYSTADNHFAMLLVPDVEDPRLGAPPLTAVVRDGCAACAELEATPLVRDEAAVAVHRISAPPPPPPPSSRRTRTGTSPPPAPKAAAVEHHQLHFVLPRLRGEAVTPHVRFGVDADGAWGLDAKAARSAVGRAYTRKPLQHQADSVALFTKPAPVALAARAAAAEVALREDYEAQVAAASGAAGGQKQRKGKPYAAAHNTPLPPPPLLVPPLPPFQPAPPGSRPPCPRVTLLDWIVGSGKTQGAADMIAAAPPPPRALVVFAVPKTLISQWVDLLCGGNARRGVGGVRFPPEWGPVDVHVVGHTELERVLYERPDALDGAYVLVDEAQVFRNLTEPGRSVVAGLARAARLWLLTGTAMQNDGDEVWGLLALLGLRGADTAGRDGEPRPSPARLACEIAAAWPRVAVLHVNPMDDPATAAHYPFMLHTPVPVPMTWTEAFAYAMVERKTVRLGPLLPSITSAKSNTYNVLTRVASNTPTKLGTIVANVIALAEAGVGATFPFEVPPGTRPRQVVHSEFVEKHGVRDVAALLQWHAPHLRMRVLSGKYTPVEEREAAWKAYNRGEVDVMVLSDVGAVGLNLLGTTAFHAVEPADNLAAEAQKLGRVNRYDSHAPSVLGLAPAGRKRGAAGAAGGKKKSKTAKTGAAGAAAADAADPMAADAADEDPMAALLAAAHGTAGEYDNPDSLTHIRVKRRAVV